MHRGHKRDNGFCYRTNICILSNFSFCIVRLDSAFHFKSKHFLELFNIPIISTFSRDDTFKRSLAALREDIMRANVLVREANFFADEMGRNTKFSVTLQIPPQNLGPNRKVS